MKYKMKYKISKGTIARTAALAVTLTNTLLTGIGKNPLPFSDTDVYNWISAAAQITAAVAAWWKNNSFTQIAMEADTYLEDLRFYIRMHDVEYEKKTDSV